MRGRCYVIDNRIKKSNAAFKVNREPAAVIYLRTPHNYIAGEGQEDGKRGLISLSVIMACFLFFTYIVMVINRN